MITEIMINVFMPAIVQSVENKIIIVHSMSLNFVAVRVMHAKFNNHEYAGGEVWGGEEGGYPWTIGFDRLCSRK